MGKYIVFWGIVDILTILWFFAKDVFNYKVPILSQLLASVRSYHDFGFGVEAYFLAIISTIVYVSLLFSGFLMIRLKILGVYISFTQIPFRLIFIIQPTFFILSEINQHILMPLWVIFILLYFVEIFKFFTQIKWLK